MSIYDTMFSSLDLRLRDQIAREALIKAVAESRESARRSSPFPSASEVAEEVKRIALDLLIKGDRRSEMRCRIVSGPSRIDIPRDRWPVHIDRVLWADVKVPVTITRKAV